MNYFIFDDDVVFYNMKLVYKNMQLMLQGSQEHIFDAVVDSEEGFELAG